VSALLAGGLGALVGVRETLVFGTVLLLVPLAVLACAPVRGLSSMPSAHLEVT
jgi:hypothetical protein